MEYNEAKQYLYHGESNGDKEISQKLLYELYAAVTDEKIEDGLNIIKRITDCNDETANLLWTDLQNDFGDEQRESKRKARESYEREKALEEYKYRNNAECPYCHSKNTKRISGFSKAGSVALFGVFAMGKVGKQWHCNQCKSDF